MVNAIRHAIKIYRLFTQNGVSVCVFFGCVFFHSVRLIVYIIAEPSKLHSERIDNSVHSSQRLVPLTAELFTDNMSTDYHMYTF